MYYVLKVKGKAKIPDYIQIRDQNFALVGYFRADRPIKDLDKYGLEHREAEIQEIVNELPYGKLYELTD